VTPQPEIQSVKVRGSCRPVEWIFASYPLFTHSLVDVLYENAYKMRLCPIMHELHVVPLMKRQVLKIFVNNPPKTTVHSIW
jgi:hypothetical protein